jgi:hypothetical protein
VNTYPRLTTDDGGGDPPNQAPALNPGAVRFAAFTPMNDQPALAERKSAFVIGAGGLLLSTTLLFVTPLSQFTRCYDFSGGMVLGLTFAIACVILIGVRVAYRCYTLPTPPQPANPLFFQNVAAGELSDYADNLRLATDADALRSVLEFNHTMARLGASKFRLAGQALLCLRVAIPLWVLLLTVVALRG